jgi:hypothetical protein
MPNTILGARLSWHFANGWVFEPAIVGPQRRATRWTACNPTLLLPASSSGSHPASLVL